MLSQNERTSPLSPPLPIGQDDWAAYDLEHARTALLLRKAEHQLHEAKAKSGRTDHLLVWTAQTKENERKKTIAGCRLDNAECAARLASEKESVNLLRLAIHELGEASKDLEGIDWQG